MENLKVNIAGNIVTCSQEELDKYLYKFPGTSYYIIS